MFKLTVKHLDQLFYCRIFLLEIFIGLIGSIELRFSFLLLADNLQHDLVETGFLLNKGQYLLFAVVECVFLAAVVYLQENQVVFALSANRTVQRKCQIGIVFFHCIGIILQGAFEGVEVQDFLLPFVPYALFQEFAACGNGVVD